MKLVRLLILVLFIPFTGSTQVVPGFDENEALDMIQLCNSYSFIDLFDNDSEIIPKGYERTYSSGVFGMDNKFQIYSTNKGYSVINFRGSTDKKISWMENFYSSMIPSEGTIKIEDQVLDYKFATNDKANVHSGYALGLTYLRNDIIFHIKNLNAQGIYDIIITGHSQGGALSQLWMSYLHNLPEGVISSKNKFKVYAFGAPMIGNKDFADEYTERYCNSEMSFLILNPADVVPNLPLSYNDELKKADFVNAILNTDQSIGFKELAYSGFMNLFEEKITSLSGWLSGKVGSQIDDDLGEFEMPEFTNEINYVKAGTSIDLDPVEYPIHLKDSTILEDKQRMRELEVGEDGYFTDKSLYETGKNFYQHKPYNYYVGVLKRYFPRRYKKMEPKYLAENL